MTFYLFFLIFISVRATLSRSQAHSPPPSPIFPTAHSRCIKQTISIQKALAPTLSAYYMICAMDSSNLKFPPQNLAAY